MVIIVDSSHTRTTTETLHLACVLHKIFPLCDAIVFRLHATRYGAELLLVEQIATRQGYAGITERPSGEQLLGRREGLSDA
jgi:hypothetical protein